MKKLVFFGDSVTETHRNINDSNDLGQGFVVYLNGLYPHLKFYNRGISGQRIKDLLSRVEDDVLSINPDVCFVWIGVNDAWLPYLLNHSFSISSFKSDYEYLIKLIKDKLKNTRIVLIKPFVLPVGQVTIEVSKDTELFRKQTEELADQYKLDYIDIKNSVEQRLRFMPIEQFFHDGIHPTLKGYQLITKVISDYIKETYYNKSSNK
jgi:acyl-CoA thioesterase I